MEVTQNVKPIEGQGQAVPDSKVEGPKKDGTTPSPPDKGSAPGTEFAEFSNPQDAARFKRVYGHVKRNERLIGVMAGDNKVLFEANNALTTRLSELEKHVADKGTADSISILQAERQAAIDAGDIARVSNLSDKIAEIRGKTEIAKLRSEAKVEKNPESKEQSPQDLLGPDLRGALQSWAGQRNQAGDLIRPWASPEHPRFNRAVELAAVVLNDPEFQADGDTRKVLAEVDRLMTPARQGQAVLSGGQGANVVQKTIKLTADQLAVAAKMNVKPEAYALMLQKYRRT